jgi:hypothetical protein
MYQNAAILAAFLLAYSAVAGRTVVMDCDDVKIAAMPSYFDRSGLDHDRRADLSIDREDAVHELLTRCLAEFQSDVPITTMPVIPLLTRCRTGDPSQTLQRRVVFSVEGAPRLGLARSNFLVSSIPKPFCKPDGERCSAEK